MPRKKTAVRRKPSKNKRADILIESAKLYKSTALTVAP